MNPSDCLRRAPAGGAGASVGCSASTIAGPLDLCRGVRLRLAFRSSQSIQAENLFVRRQLALYIERGVKPRRIDPATRIFLTLLSRLFDWRGAVAVVRP